MSASSPAAFMLHEVKAGIGHATVAQIPQKLIAVPPDEVQRFGAFRDDPQSRTVIRAQQNRDAAQFDGVQQDFDLAIPRADDGIGNLSMRLGAVMRTEMGGIVASDHDLTARRVVRASSEGGINRRGGLPRLCQRGCLLYTSPSPRD